MRFFHVLFRSLAQRGTYYFRVQAGATGGLRIANWQQTTGLVLTETKARDDSNPFRCRHLDGTDVH